MTEKEISGAELEIIQILWDLGKPAKTQEICDYSGGSPRNYSTTATLLGRMKEKGADVAKILYDGCKSQQMAKKIIRKFNPDETFYKQAL